MFIRQALHHRQFRYLGAFYLHSIIRLFAVSMFQIFTSLYIFQSLKNLGFSNSHALGITSLFFALIFLVHAMSVAPVLWIISKKGLKFCLVVGEFMLIAFFLSLYLFQYDPIFLIITGILGGLQVGLYWTAYHLYFIQLSDDKSQGQEIALGHALSALAGIGGPAFGGLIIAFFGYNAIFIVMTILIAGAAYPLRYLPNTKNEIKFDILETVRALAPKAELKSFIALFGGSVIDIVALNFWPLYIFGIVAGYLGVGFIGSLIALISTIVVVVVGLLIDKYGAQIVIRILSPLDSLLWVFKFFSNTPFRVYFASGAQALTTTGQMITLDSIIYKRARHINIAAFIVQREIGLSLGRFIFMCTVGILFWFGMPLPIIFLMAAVGSLLTVFYPFDQAKIKDEN